MSGKDDKLYESGYFLNSHTGENEHRPYERCMALGASSLSDAQLIAAILRTGTKGIDATKLAEEIIKTCGRFDTNDNDSLIGLANLSIPELMKIKGVGRVKAPFSALDYQTRLTVCDDVRQIIRQEKKTAILVTHDLSEAISMADRVLVLGKRPASIHLDLPTIFEDQTLSPMNRRQAPEFQGYFNQIWKELNHHE